MLKEVRPAVLAVCAIVVLVLGLAVKFHSAPAVKPVAKPEPTYYVPPKAKRAMVKAEQTLAVDPGVGRTKFTFGTPAITGSPVVIPPPVQSQNNP